MSISNISAIPSPLPFKEGASAQKPSKEELDALAHSKEGLHDAVRKGDFTLTKLLLEHGADINAQNEKGETALHIAARIKNVDIVKLLIRDGAQNKKDKLGYTPLRYALLTKNNLGCAKILLDAGISPLSKDNDGNTDMHAAVVMGSRSAVKLLLEGKSEHFRDDLIQTKNKAGLTPLHVASMRKRKGVVKLLLQEHANLEVKDIKGYTPLFYAVQYNSPEVARLLLEAGATARVAFNKRTLLSRAEKKKADQLVEILKPYDKTYTKNLPEADRLVYQLALHHPILHGAHRYKTYKTLEDSFKKFNESQPESSLWSKENNQNVQRAVEYASASDVNVDDVMKRIQNGETVIIPAGWPGVGGLNGHATAIVISGSTLVKCNRGDGSEGMHGMHFYEITKPDQLREVLENVVKYQSDKSGIGKEYFTQTIDERLGLKHENWVKKKGQTSGNCPWASAKLALEASMILELRKSHPDLEFSQLTALSHKIYAPWSSFYRLEALKNASPEAILDWDLFLPILNKCLKEKRLDQLNFLIERYPEELRIFGSDTRSVAKRKGETKVLAVLTEFKKSSAGR
jgi:ankyrin repeat protein